MGKGIFITACGTDIGKTYIAGLLVKYFKEKGINCGYYKPVISGYNEDEINDLSYVCDMGKINIDPKIISTYRFNNPVSPHLAAKLENKLIDIIKIKEDYNRLIKKYDILIVEGCGGLTCPLQINDKGYYLVADMVRDLKLDVITVIPSKLGSIHGALSSLEFAKSKRIINKGFIMNNWVNNDIVCKDNKKTIEYITKNQVLATVCNNEKSINFKESIVF